MDASKRYVLQQLNESQALVLKPSSDADDRFSAVCDHYLRLNIGKLKNEHINMDIGRHVRRQISGTKRCIVFFKVFN